MLTTKLRQLFGSVRWDSFLVGWLHAAVLDLLDRELLEEYVEILRVLRAKVKSKTQKRNFSQNAAVVFRCRVLPVR